jgi:hypothetical protein
MKRLFYGLFFAFILIVTTSASVIEPSTLPAAEKPLTALSKAEIKKLSIVDMEKYMGRKMSRLEKSAFKLNKKKFAAYVNMEKEGRTNTMAIVGFVCSLIISPLGLIFGIIALGQLKRSGERGRGWATAAVIIGALGTILGLILYL